MSWGRVIGWGISIVCIGLILGWTIRRSDKPGKLTFKWIVTAATIATITLLFTKFFNPTGTLNFAAAFFLAISAVVGGLILAVTWTSDVIFILTSPLTRLFWDEHEQIEPKPLYSAAQAQRKKGQYTDAILSVQEQLDRFPDDLTGVLLLAEIHATNLHDLPTAEQLLEAFIARTTAANAVVALNLIADWRLGLNGDVPGTREALEQIRRRCPDTEAAFMASQRLAHLADDQAVGAVRHPKTIAYVEFPVPERVGEVLDVRPKPIEPGVESANLVKHLEEFPEDFDARERLALLYADHFKRIDLARMQMEELIGNKRAPQKKVVAWLNRLADIELHEGQDIELARAALQRIVDMNPKLAAAEQARRRIGLLGKELKRYSASLPAAVPINPVAPKAD